MLRCTSTGKLGRRRSHDRLYLPVQEWYRSRTNIRVQGTNITFQVLNEYGVFEFATTELVSPQTVLIASTLETDTLAVGGIYVKNVKATYLMVLCRRRGLDRDRRYSQGNLYGAPDCDRRHFYRRRIPEKLE